MRPGEKLRWSPPRAQHDTNIPTLLLHSHEAGDTAAPGVVFVAIPGPQKFKSVHRSDRSRSRSYRSIDAIQVLRRMSL